MRRELQGLFSEAMKDWLATDCDGKEYRGRLSLGIKITQDHSGRVRLFNTHLGGGFYKELTPDETEYFRVFGWSLGVFYLALKNTKHKLDAAEAALKAFASVKRHTKMSEELECHVAYLKERQKYLLCQRQKFITHIKSQSNDRHNEIVSVSGPQPSGPEQVRG